jgi:hypothetical protein
MTTVATVNKGLARDGQVADEGEVVKSGIHLASFFLFVFLGNILIII